MGGFPSVKEFSLCGVVVPSPGREATGPSGPVARVLGPFFFVFRSGSGFVYKMGLQWDLLFSLPPSLS